MKRIYNKKKKYNICDLYVGVVGIVSKKDGYFNCDSESLNNKYIIGEKKFKASFEHELYLKSPINGCEYCYFHDTHFDKDDFLGTCMVFNIIPLSQFICDITKITLGELIELENSFNNHDKESKNKNTEDDINDPILKVILETSNKIKNGNISNEDKEYLYELLSDLGKYYVSELIKIKSNREIKLETKSPIDVLRMDVIYKLNEIENEINKALIVGNINRELLAFNRVLEKN